MFHGFTFPHNPICTEESGNAVCPVKVSIPGATGGVSDAGLISGIAGKLFLNLGTAICKLMPKCSPLESGDNNGTPSSEIIRRSQWLNVEKHLKSFLASSAVLWITTLGSAMC